MSLFRGWSRLCLHAASLSVAEGASAAATTAARAERVQRIQKEAEAATDMAAASSKLIGATTQEGLQADVVSTAPQSAVKAQAVLHRQGAQLVRTGSASSAAVVLSEIFHSMRHSRS